MKKEDPKRGGRILLADVARLAGVSPASASLALNGVAGARISTETRQRVLDAAKTLNYRFNVAARGLATRRTHTLGFISDEIAATEFAGGLIAGSQQAAWEQNMQLFVVDTTGDPAIESAAIEAMIDREVEGVIFAAMSAREVEPPKALFQVPAVLLNCFSPKGDFPTVLTDERFGGYLATKVLSDAGHQRIAFLNGRREGRGAWASSQRLLGYQQALVEAGIGFEEALVHYGNWQPDSGYANTKTLLDLRNPPTAIFCANDRMAMGCYEAIREHGLSVPEDMSVVGYDNQPLSAYMFPPLTTVDLPHERIGQAACNLLQTVIAHERPDPTELLVRGELIPRSSVASPHH